MLCAPLTARKRGVALQASPKTASDFTQHTQSPSIALPVPRGASIVDALSLVFFLLSYQISLCVCPNLVEKYLEFLSLMTFGPLAIFTFWPSLFRLSNSSPLRPVLCCRVKTACKKQSGSLMSCVTWGRVASEDEVRLLVGPAAVIGTILAAIARAIRPDGMSIGTRGRRAAIAGASLLAIACLILMVLAIYANETCVDTIIFGRTGDSEVTLLQMFWMLVPGVSTAAITSAICNLAATRLSLPRKTKDSWASWKVDHIPAIVQNGVVSPRDDYGMGIGKLARYSPLWCLASGAWLFVTAVMVYVTARGDLTNGLLNLAGLLAVATNTGIPAWNISKSGSGQDTKSRNVDLVRTVETNVVGNFYDNVAAVTTTVADKEKTDGVPMVLGRTQLYIVANAHATIADYRGDEMDVNHFTSKEKEENEAKALAKAIVAAANETTKRLSRVLTEAEKGDEATELMTLSAYMCTVADNTAWEDKPAQRRRLLALSMAIAWAMKITGGYGGKIARTDSTLELDKWHEAGSCSCCLHRWTVWRPLQASPDKEMEFLFGR